MSELLDLCPTCGAYWACDCPVQIGTLFGVPVFEVASEEVSAFGENILVDTTEKAAEVAIRYFKTGDW